MLHRASFGVPEYYSLMASGDFLPNSPTLMNAGTPNGQLAACFKLNIKDSMLGTDGIMDVATKAAAIQKFGGGVGYVFDELRPKGSPISTTHGKACGVVLVMGILQSIAKMVTQGGKREGAQMAILSISHPDIFDFIHAKDDGTDTFSTFNLSVSIPDSFMQALSKDENWNLVDPHGGTVWRTVKAKDLWNEICISAWKTGDPGVFFVDTVERANPTPWLGKLDGSNPCLVGSTRMLTKDGLLTIAELADTSSEYATPTGWSMGTAWRTGTKDVVNVVLSNGQSIISTPDHKYVVGEEWVEADELEGSYLEPFVWRDAWIGLDEFEAETLTLLGFMQGDGGYHTASGGYYAHVGQRDGDVDDLFNTLGYKKHGYRRRYIPSKSSLAREADRIGMSHEPLPHRILPSQLWKQSPNSAKAFLRGLYSANGSVLESVGRITLKSTSLPMLREVQLLMLALGFRPYITTNRPSEITWPNGVFTSRTSYDINIAKSEVSKFNNEIGFIHRYKTESAYRVGDTRSIGSRHSITVIAVEPVGETDVYDFHVASSVHAGWADGFLVSNCGEVPLLDGESCNLGSINLANFVSIVGRFDYDRLIPVVHIAIGFLDRILTENVYPMDSFREAALRTRKLGLGIMGWADCLALMHIPYDSTEATDLADSIMGVIHTEALKESESLGRRLGAYPASESDEHHYRSPHAQRRNAAVTCIAPTGTISQIVGVSSGIEPHFALENDRLMGDGTVLHERVTVLDRIGDFIPKTAHQILPDWHVEHQAVFQRHVDLAVSKTINMPEFTTVGDISMAFQKMWQSNVKGGTVFRDGSREGVLRDTTETVEASPGIVEKHPEARPRSLPAEVTKLATGHGNLYMAVTFKDGNPFETFSHLGKAGGCDSAQLEAISRLTSLALRSGIPTEEIVKQLQGITCCPTWDDGILIKSIPDGMAHVLSRIIRPEQATQKESAHATGTVLTPIGPRGERCPECDVTLIHQEGCKLCTGCGYSRC